MRSARTRRRAVRRRRGGVLGVLGAGVLLLTTVGVALPASACACGAYVTNGDTSISHERAAIKWDGTIQDLVVSVDVLGESADAGFLIPVPAQAEVTREETELFDELATETQPLEQPVTNWWPNLSFLEMLGITNDNSDSAGADNGVTVLEQRQLGDITVAQLAASDPTALATWLNGNGYAGAETLTAAAAPYAQAGWTFVAAKLTASPEAGPLTGTLQPLRLRFPSAEPVYPMRLSQLATQAITVELYVLAPNRMDPEFTAVPGQVPSLTYAGWLDPANIGPVSRVGQWLTDRTFLTRYEQVVADPSQISGDYTFIQSPSDGEYQAVVYVDRDLGWLTGGLLAVLGLTLLAVVPTRIMYKRRIRAERRLAETG